MSRCVTGPPAHACRCHVDDSDCIMHTGAGHPQRPYRLTWNIDPVADNALSCGPSGLVARVPNVILKPPHVRAYAVTTLSIPPNEFFAYPFADVLEDTDGIWNPGTATEFLCNTGGVYKLGMAAGWRAEGAGGATKFRACQIRKNGFVPLLTDSQIAVSSVSGTDGSRNSVTGSTVTELELGDTIEFAVIHNEDGDKAVESQAAFSVHAWMTYMGPLAA